jgi:hypothetical protein
MFGRNKPIDDTINTRVDHHTVLKNTVNAACSVAENAGVSLAYLRDFFKGCHVYYTQRAMYAADAPVARAQTPTPEVAAAIAARARRAEQKLEAERRAYRESVDRAAENAGEYSRRRRV